MTVFNPLSPELKGEVEKYEVKYEGIRLTVSEDQLISAVYKLLKEKSEHKNSNSKKFYKGNYATKSVFFLEKK